VRVLDPVFIRIPNGRQFRLECLVHQPSVGCAQSGQTAISPAIELIDRGQAGHLGQEFEHGQRAFDALAANALARKSREKALKSPVFIALDH
jgi:hypothetical protein